MVKPQRSSIGTLVAVLVIGAITACGKGDSGSAIDKPSGHDVAGVVEELTGQVSAEWKSEAGEGMRALALGGEVFADDTIVTGDGASITIRLHHNNVRWALGGGKRMALVGSASWNAPRAGGESVLAGGRSADDTAVAGRHAEREAADTAATAMAKSEESAPEAEPAAPMPVPAAQPPSAPPPPPAKPMRRSKSKPKPSSRPRSVEIQGGGPDESEPGGGVAVMPLKLGQAADVSGSLSRTDIQKVIKQHSSEIKRCYEKALQEKPGIAGKVTVKLTIAPSGKVTGAQVVSSTVDYEPLEQCITARVRTWKFPAHDGGDFNVTYPFAFQAP